MADIKPKEAAKPTTNIYAELLELSKKFAPWQHEALRCLFKHGGISATAKSEIMQLLLVQAGLIPGPASLSGTPLAKEELPSPPEVGKRVVLNRISKLTNVNALKEDQAVHIGKHLTIVYGENGSGKSGFARVMKRAFRARAVDDILPNVYKASSGAMASANFDIEENDEKRSELWRDDGTSIKALGRFAVFDSKCARVYITDDSDLSFRPYGFDILQGLVQITDEVKADLQTRAKEAAPKNDALKLLINDTPTGKFTASITNATKEEDIKARAAWSVDDDEVLKTKEQEVARLRLNDPASVKDALQKQQSSLERIRNTVQALDDVIGVKGASEMRNHAETLTICEEAVVTAASLAFQDIALPGVGSAVWQQLIRAAAQFAMTEAYPGQAFPLTEKGKCVLCLQDLSDEARSRLERFWKFVENEVATKRDQAKAIWETDIATLEALPDVMPNEVEMSIESLKGSGSNVPDELKQYYVEAFERMAQLKDAALKRDWSLLSKEAIAPIHLCGTEIASLQKRIEDIGDGNNKAPIAALDKDIEELRTRKLYKDNIAVVIAYWSALKRSADLQSTADGISTTALTKKARELETKLVTEEFKRGVREELQAMGISNAKAVIDEKAAKGKVLHRVRVEGAPGVAPENVFSEGERTAISIACFVAELRTNNDNCGIVLDDPVNSLDHRIREAVVKVLVREAKNRQVIIFTHDLLFYRELHNEAERQEIDVTFQLVESIGGHVGLLSHDPPWYAMDTGKRVAFLQKLLAEAKKAEDAGDVEAYKTIHSQFYNILRSAWERSVEELLFNKVIGRLEKEVKTKSLVGVCVDDEGIKAVTAGMTHTSKMIDAHDPAMAIGKSLGAYTQLKDDLAAFEQFRTGQRSKIKKVEEKRQTLI